MLQSKHRYFHNILGRAMKGFKFLVKSYVEDVSSIGSLECYVLLKDLRSNVFKVIWN